MVKKWLSRSSKITQRQAEKFRKSNFLRNSFPSLLISTKLLEVQKFCLGFRDIVVFQKKSVVSYGCADVLALEEGKLVVLLHHRVNLGQVAQKKAVLIITIQLVWRSFLTKMVKNFKQRRNGTAFNTMEGKMIKLQLLLFFPFFFLLIQICFLSSKQNINCTAVVNFRIQTPHEKRKSFPAWLGLLQ